MTDKKTILIVEDENSLRKALVSKLEQEYNVLEAINGAEGLRMALTDKPNLILLDIIMPKMDGMSMLKELRKDSWGKDAKVIMLTNLSDATKAEEASENKVHDYLIKSDWKIADIHDKIKEMLA